MSNEDEMIHFGAYILALDDVRDTNQHLICERGEIALIFSRHRSVNNNKPVDLLFESGNSSHGHSQDMIRKHFRHLYTDADFVICGCSSNDGWDLARQKIQKIKPK